MQFESRLSHVSSTRDSGLNRHLGDKNGDEKLPIYLMLIIKGTGN